MDHPGPLRLVAVGDSLSEGIGDPVPGRPGWDGALHGWVHHLVVAAEAEGTPVELVANLARRGVTVAGLRAWQLRNALRLRPDVVTCPIGVNDALFPSYDRARFERDYRHVIAGLSAGARVGVVTMTLPDVAAALPLPPRTKANLRRRLDSANAVIEAVSEAYGGWLLDARGSGSLVQAGLLSIDRLHPNRVGHRLLAERMLALLREHGALGPGSAVLTAVEPVSPGQRLRGEAEYAGFLARHVIWPELRRQTRLRWRSLVGRMAGNT